MTEAIFHEEEAALARTIGIIKDESKLAKKEYDSAYEELMEARSGDPDKLPIREMLYTRSKMTLSHLSDAALKPYFTRIDFSDTPGVTDVCYIGKHGVTLSQNMEIVVYDWRAPISNLYYCGQLGHVSYEAPDGKIEGELSLKRQFEIENGKLLSVFDTDIVSQDSYLQKALSSMSADRLRDIVSTIQSEQNLVIRHPLNQNLIVQGVAGSGKTTIALHRVAYLLYAYADRLKADRVMILAPSPLFMNYISGVLPDLGVENIRQTTLSIFLTSFLSLREGALKTDTGVDPAVSRAMGSLKLGRKLTSFLDRYEHLFAPEGGIAFGPVKVYTREEIEHFLLVDEAPFPMKYRVNEFKKQLTHRVNGAAASICAWYKSECDRRAEMMRKKYGESAELGEKVKALYKSSAQRIEETKAQTAPFVKKIMDEMPSMDIFDLYKAFLTELSADEDGSLSEAAKYTLSYFKPGCIHLEDLAPLSFIAMRMRETVRMPIRHIVIDEAQDLSPLQISFLRSCMPDATFTLVGDLMQGITESRGVSNWDELTDGVFEGKCSYTALTTSYRSTKEIMETAFRASSLFQDTSKLTVVRSGSPVTFQRFGSEKEQIALIESETARFLEAGCHSVGIIAKTAKDAEKLHKKLSGIEGLRLLTHEDTEFGGGLYVTCAAQAKGLEFDAVILPDASAGTYAEGEVDARLLYVALTRPMHHLSVLYVGALTPLLMEN